MLSTIYSRRTTYHGSIHGLLGLRLPGYRSIGGQPSVDNVYIHNDLQPGLLPPSNMWFYVCMCLCGQWRCLARGFRKHSGWVATCITLPGDGINVCLGQDVGLWGEKAIYNSSLLLGLSLCRSAEACVLP